MALLQWLTKVCGKCLCLPCFRVCGNEANDVPTPKRVEVRPLVLRSKTSAGGERNREPTLKRTFVHFIRLLSTSYVPGQSAAVAVAQVRARALRPGCQGVLPGFATWQLCDFGQVT